MNILKIALSRSIFQPKMHQIALGGRAPLRPAGSASPRPSSWIKGSLLLREGVGREWREWSKEDGRGGRRWEGNGRGAKGRRRKEGRGRGPLSWILDTPL